MAYRTSAAPTHASGLVVLGTYLHGFAAEVARARLEAEGVRAFVTEVVNPLRNTAGEGASLAVAARDEEQARMILEALRLEELADEPDDDVERRCPRCESEYCFFEASRRSTGGKRWRCRKCEHEWDDDEEGRGLRRTVLAEGDPRPVFRLRRTSPGLGLLGGVAVGGLLAAALDGAVATSAFFASAIVGAIIGRAVRTDVCSEPSCRAPLARGIETCPQCHGVLAGRVTSAADHHAAAADVRRDLTRGERRKKKRAALADESGR